MKKFLVIALCSMVFWACSKKMAPAKTAAPPVAPAVAMPEVKPAETARINMALLERGKKIFENRCGRCHALKQPVDLEQQKWVGVMERMAPKAQLDETQKAEVLAYVQHYAKDAPKDKSNM
jgi:mono/diheme cytochrome c family protein